MPVFTREDTQENIVNIYFQLLKCLIMIVINAINQLQILSRENL